MLDRFRRRLLGTTLPVAMSQRHELSNATTAQATPVLTGAEILANLRKAVDALGPKPRWAGGAMAFEIDPGMLSGWFGLREPGGLLPYAGPLPSSSFGIFYRGGDVVRLSPRDHAELMRRMGVPDARGAQR